MLQLLVAYETIYDYLDSLSERGVRLGLGTGEALFHALKDAVDPWSPSDAARYFCGAWPDDGGYLTALVEACRVRCRALPGYPAIRALVLREASRMAVLALNHEPDPVSRRKRLRSWQMRCLPDVDDLQPFELTAAASHTAPTLACFALAADCGLARDVKQVYDAYVPWFGLVGTMLDAYVDQAEDRASGAHSYIQHYPRHEDAVERLCESVGQAAARLLALPNGERHAVLLGCMVAMYLSKDSARSPELRASTERIVTAGGRLTRLLLPVLRAWRVCNRQTSRT